MKHRLRIIVFQVILILVGIIAVEIALRLMGYQPGDLKPNWLNFKQVDSLYAIPDFYTNGDGIQVANRKTMLANNTYVNTEGFRTKEFSAIDTTKKKVLFIGDSFTWGLSAHPIDSCFVDILRLRTNYEVINLGIPIADPAQYLAVARKYVPLLKPDMVLVVFFMGNDLMIYDREVTPYEPLYFYTNAGAILADIDGKHFHTAQEAYNYCANDKYLLKHPQNAFEWIVSKSALLSRLYSIKFRIKEKEDYERTVKDSHITKKYLYGIEDIAKANHTTVKFILIPSRNEADMSHKKYVQKHANILQDEKLKGDWLIPENTSANFTAYPDAHLNNVGHGRYEDFIEAYLKKSLGP